MARLTAEDVRDYHRSAVAESVARRFDDAIVQQLELGPFPEMHARAQRRVSFDLFFGDVASQILDLHDPHIEEETDESA